MITRIRSRFDRRDRAWNGIAAAVLTVFAVATLWVALNIYVAPTDATARNELVRTLAQIIGGALLFVGAYFTWRRVAAADVSNKVAQEGQVTERFTRAIDQIGAESSSGSPRIEVRLGGIYALERIARDSSRDRGPILEILTAYVRENSPWTPDYVFEKESRTERLPVERPAESDSTALERDAAQSSQSGPRSDIQAVLAILARWPFTEGSNERPVNLSGTDLHGADMSGFHLDQANFTDANLSGVDFAGTSLIGSDFRGSRLTNANFSGANLQGANLYGADLSGRVLANMNFEGANLGRTNLSGSVLVDSNLTRANLKGANLTSASLERADLRGADLSKTKGLQLVEVRKAHTDLSTKKWGRIVAGIEVAGSSDSEEELDQERD